MTVQPDPTPAPLLDTAATQPVVDTVPSADPPASDPNPVVPGNATPADDDKPMTRKEIEAWYAEQEAKRSSVTPAPPKPVAPAPAPKPADPPATPAPGSGKAKKPSKWFAGRPPQE